MISLRPHVVPEPLGFRKEPLAWPLTLKPGGFKVSGSRVNARPWRLDSLSSPAGQCARGLGYDLAFEFALWGPGRLPSSQGNLKDF